MKIGKRNARIGRLQGAWLFTFALLGTASSACPADDYPSGFSLASPVVIGGVVSHDASNHNDETVILPAKGGEAIRSACLQRGLLLLQGESRPRTCTQVVAKEQVLLLWLNPTLHPVTEAVSLPPVIFSAAPFPAQRFTERAATRDETLAVQGAMVGLPSASTNLAKAVHVTAIDAPTRGLTYFLATGRHLLDGNEEEQCATTATLVFLKDAHGLSYAGELDAQPASFLLRVGSDTPDAVVTKNCGKQMSLWQLAPKVRKLIDYDNGYEYGG